MITAQFTHAIPHSGRRPPLHGPLPPPLRSSCAKSMMMTQVQIVRFERDTGDPGEDLLRHDVVENHTINITARRMHARRRTCRRLN